MELNLGTKAETLSRICGKLKYATVLPLVSFTLKKWKTHNKLLWNVVKKELSGTMKPNFIIRSSCLEEDKSTVSNAGKYLSVLNVRTEQEFLNAVGNVFESYIDDGRNENDNDQVLIQTMLEDVALCGVAFTMDPNTGGNYYVVNYDASGATDGITSGSDAGNALYYHYKYADEIATESNDKEFITDLLLTLKELEELFGKENLDVEFAVDSHGELYIFQVRELCLKSSFFSKINQTEILKGIYQRVEEEQRKKPFLCGDRTIYSVMTDWNPAEMIGIYPKPLALSLYREIITDSVWAYQRDNYGYRNLRSFPLLIELGGVPYIDVRVSFNSFVPAGLEEDIGEKLVNYYLDRLAESPEEHDKAEFNIVFSCYTLDLQERICVLKRYGFTDREIESIINALRHMTNRIIDHENGLWKKDYEKIEKLKVRYDEIVTSGMSDIDKVYWLLEDCKRYGTLPFAGLARAAFVAVQLLKSMVTVGIISQNDYDKFMKGVNSVSSQMKDDLMTLSREEFLRKYGHLRPGTYDITSPRYDEKPDFYFDWSGNSVKKEDTSEDVFRMSMEQMKKLREKFDINGLNSDILEIFDFIKKVIEGREYGKFVFTRNLSMALQIIKKMGRDRGLTAEDMSYINIHAIYELYSSSKNPSITLKEYIMRGKESYGIMTALRLPPVIIDSSDVLSFYYPDSEPNYITLGRVLGDVLDIKGAETNRSLKDKILMIPSADPGYDWIFSRGIAGFVTMYGGANSHMAIRAGELGIPAVIGAGEKLFEKLSKAKVVEINAATKQVTILR